MAAAEQDEELEELVIMEEEVGTLAVFNYYSKDLPLFHRRRTSLPEGWDPLPEKDRFCAPEALFISPDLLARARHRYLGSHSTEF